MKITIIYKEQRNIYSVLGNCSSSSSKVTYNLYMVLSHYTNSFSVKNDDIISNYCRAGNNNLIYPIYFSHATMELSLEQEGLDFLNTILSIANLPLLDDPNNPSGLIFNIKVK